jgi:uncharacterized protein YdbL (DUF1318 family)
MNTLLCQIIFISFNIAVLATNPKTQETRFKFLYERTLKNIQIPSTFVPEPWGQPHRNVSYVVLAVAMGGGWMPRNAKTFLGTLRKTGYEDDIVIGIDEGASNDFKKTIASFNAVIYDVKSQCTGQHLTHRCVVNGYQGTSVSVNMVRYLLYQWWALKYSEHTVILISDFRDVLFQSNPFTYMPNQWMPPVAQLTLFLEPVPLKVQYIPLSHKVYLSL